MREFMSARGRRLGAPEWTYKEVIVSCSCHRVCVRSRRAAASKEKKGTLRHCPGDCEALDFTLAR